MKNRIFLINGYPRTGKDSLADYMIKKFDTYGLSAFVHSSVDSIKHTAKMLGWNGVKDEHGRNALSSLKDWSTEWFDNPFNEICEVIDGLDEEEVAIFMVREPEEISRLVKEYPEIITICVERSNHVTANNHADKNIDNYSYDWYIENNSTLTELKESADKLIEHLYGEEK